MIKALFTSATGMNAQATVIDNTRTRITTYFRRTFTVSNVYWNWA